MEQITFNNNCEMNKIYEDMRQNWQTRTPEVIGRSNARHSSVLVPLVERDGRLEVLFEVRAAALHRQPGEVCFPGGACEEGETTEETAIRETTEELLVNRSQIHILAPLDYLETPGGVTVWTYLGVLDDYRETFSSDEVDHVFTVPLDWLLENEPERYQCTVHTVPNEDFPFHLIPDGKEYHWKKGRYDVYFYQYHGEIIWGMTAKILQAFIKLYRKTFAK